MAERKAFPLRVDARLFAAVERWADRDGLLALAEHIERRVVEREQAGPRARLRACATAASARPSRR